MCHTQAKANRGILYVDEVNLLDDHLVDVLLDSAASGWNTVEREGISISHPARFILVGSGERCRPQAPFSEPLSSMSLHHIAALPEASSRRRGHLHQPSRALHPVGSIERSIIALAEVPKAASQK